MTLFTFLIYIIVILSSCCLGYLFFTKSINYMENKHVVNNFDKYIVILNYFMQSSYEVIYRDKIFVYSQQGFTPNEDDIKSSTRDFVKLTVELMGRELKNKLVKIFGSEEVLFRNMTEYFNNNILKDEIREMSLSSIPEQASNNNQIGV